MGSVYKWFLWKPFNSCVSDSSTVTVLLLWSQWVGPGCSTKINWDKVEWRQRRQRRGAQAVQVCFCSCVLHTHVGVSEACAASLCRPNASRVNGRSRQPTHKPFSHDGGLFFYGDQQNKEINIKRGIQLWRTLKIFYSSVEQAAGWRPPPTSLLFHHHPFPQNPSLKLFQISQQGFKKSVCLRAALDVTSVLLWHKTAFLPWQIKNKIG